MREHPTVTPSEVIDLWVRMGCDGLRAGLDYLVLDSTLAVGEGVVEGWLSMLDSAAQTPITAQLLTLRRRRERLIEPRYLHSTFTNRTNRAAQRVGTLV